MVVSFLLLPGLWCVLFRDAIKVNYECPFKPHRTLAVCQEIVPETGLGEKTFEFVFHLFPAEATATTYHHPRDANHCVRSSRSIGEELSMYNYLANYKQSQMRISSGPIKNGMVISLTPFTDLELVYLP